MAGRAKKETNMSVISGLGSAPRLRAGIGEGARMGFARIWRAAGAVARVLTTRRGLADMDDRMLADLGISRAQAQFEMSRPVWELARRDARR